MYIIHIYFLRNAIILIESTIRKKLIIQIINVTLLIIVYNLLFNLNETQFIIIDLYYSLINSNKYFIHLIVTIIIVI